MQENITEVRKFEKDVDSDVLLITNRKETFLCGFCRRSFKNENQLLNHRQGCKKRHSTLEKIFGTNQDSLRSLYTRAESGHLKSDVYVHCNESYVSGIGELASRCFSFIGNRIISVIESGLIVQKKHSIYELFRSLQYPGDAFRTALESPDLNLVSALNDLLLFVHYEGLFSDKLGYFQKKAFMSNLILIRSLEHLIEGSTAYSTRTKNRRWVKVYELESRRIKPDISTLRQLLAIMRVLAAHRESSIKVATAIALVILESSGYITELLSYEEIESVIHDLRNDTKYVLDIGKRCTPNFYILNEPEYVSRTLLESFSESRSDTELELLRSAQCLVVSDMYRTYVYATSKSKCLQFGTMSYIVPCLTAVMKSCSDSELEYVRHGFREITRSYLSLVDERWTRGNQIGSFRDVLAAIDFLDCLNSNSSAWDAALYFTLVKRHTRFSDLNSADTSTKLYWWAIQGYREISKDERYSERSRVILEDEKILGCLVDWLGIADLDTREISWDDLDPNDEWKSGFWHVPEPPSGIEKGCAAYCPEMVSWIAICPQCVENKIIVTEEGSNTTNPRSGRTKAYCECEVIQPANYFGGYRRCGHSLSSHSIMADWKAYLSWEEREENIKEMIRKNLKGKRLGYCN